MGRQVPRVLFAQSFVHPVLDDYVDEVLFSEPVVVTACEFIEQHSSSASSTVKLLGATSPPSFALEVFVHCEGETRFRRLSQPFLYSHSSSNVLEVEAVVTNHLVIRGSYRSLSLVVYGNTAEDLGQFNIEVDIDGSVTETVCAEDGDLEDLPPGLHATNLAIEESLSPLTNLSLKTAPFDLPVEIRQLLHMIIKILESPGVGAFVHEVIRLFLSSVLVYATPLLSGVIMHDIHVAGDPLVSVDGFQLTLDEARKQLLDVYDALQSKSNHSPSESSAECMITEHWLDVDSSKQLVEKLSHYLQFIKNPKDIGECMLSQSNNTIFLSGMALLLCSARESCFHFVSGGLLEKLGDAFSIGMLDSVTHRLLFLGVIEQATRHSIGCEGFLDWWPREDEFVPPGCSKGYNKLLKLLLENQRHDVASFATYILHRLRLYEVASRYEFSVISVLGALSGVGQITNATLDMLSEARIQLKKILKLMDVRGQIEDPSPAACASRSLLLSDSGSLSYKGTRELINQSNCCFSKGDIDSNLLYLLKDKGFLPLSAALLSSSTLRSETGHSLDLYVEIVSYIQAIILSLLFCRSGLIFLLSDPDVSVTVIYALKGAADWRREESLSARYASVLISKGFFCRLPEIGFVVEIHLKLIQAIDRLISTAPGTEEFLWILWEFCGLSRSDCGCQALLALVHFPEALSVLMAALGNVTELDPLPLSTGAAPLNMAIFHASADIFEVLVADLSASSLSSWIDNASELHKALNSSSPGSNKKDAPARLLEWIDAGVVYHRNGAIGLLRYAALLASGGDTHAAPTSILSSDMMDVENVGGESTNGTDGNVIDNLLGKRIAEKDFPGVILRDSSILQLTTAFRILSSISDHSGVAACLYGEGAVVVIHAVLINCKVMLERSSNTYDYLVDEGGEGNATSELLLERNREQSIIGLLIPALVLLVNLLHKLEETQEQHRNTKLVNALLQLHREVSPKLAASASDVTYPYPESALGFEAVCHLLVSVLACWPIYGWTPGLFHFLLGNLQATSLLVLGPKDICSFFSLLNDLLPDEGFWQWKNGMPMLSAVRAFAVGTLLGPMKERDISWYLQEGHPEKLLVQLTPQLDKIAQIVLHCAISTLVVIQDMIRVFIIRIACLNSENGAALLRPMMAWISERLSLSSPLSDTDSYKVYRLLEFLAILLEHPRAKALMLMEDCIQIFVKVLEISVAASISDDKQFPEDRHKAKYRVSSVVWCIPVCKSIGLICRSRTSFLPPETFDRRVAGKWTDNEYFLILQCVLKLIQVLPVGKELVACLSAFNELGSAHEARKALLSIFSEVSLPSDRVVDGVLENFNAHGWREESPPLRSCWNRLLHSLGSRDALLVYTADAIRLLSSGALLFCMEGKSLNFEKVVAVKNLFGFVNDGSATDGYLDESIKSIQEGAKFLGPEVTESTKNLLLVLQNFTGGVNDEVDAISLPSSLSSVTVSYSKIHKVASGSLRRIEENDLGEFGNKFVWECPENLRDRLTQTGASAKRKTPLTDGAIKRSKVENASSESISPAGLSRGLVPPASLGPTRRDTFRQRKPNTSRPPSMHVDDYVARERNADGSNPNVITLPRVGSSSGRPPSIHVDEFMARQRDRQHSVGMSVTDTNTEVKTAAPETNKKAVNVDGTQQLKPDIDDDLQGIDIVFDAEESDPDDKLPFPQPDDNLPQPASVVVEQNSPHSVVAETDSEVNEGREFSHLTGPSQSYMEENTSDFSSRMSVSHPEVSLTREPSISSEKKFSESDTSETLRLNQSRGRDTAAIASNSGFSTSVYSRGTSASAQLPGDSRTMRHLYSKVGAQSGQTVAVGSQGFYDQKHPRHQPPLPPLPPPPGIASISQNTDISVSQSSPLIASVADLQPPLMPGYRAEYMSTYTSGAIGHTSSSPRSDPKNGRKSLSSPGVSTRHQPPLPPTPPPYSVNPAALISSTNPISQSLGYNRGVHGAVDIQNNMVSSVDVRLSKLSSPANVLTSYSPNSLAPPMLFGRAVSGPVSIYGSTSNPHQGENLSMLSHNLSISLPGIHSTASLPQLQPLQPPQLPRAISYSRPLIQASLQPEQAASLSQSSLQVQLQSLQMPQISPAQIFYQTPTHTETALQSLKPQVENLPAPPLHGDTKSEQSDPGMSLHEFFKSPEAIQSLLRDRDKLCQLLEQHPKLMQMLQERLGQL